MRYLRLFAVQARISIAQAMAYRANFLIEGALSVAWLGVTLLPVYVLFEHRPSFAGWDAPSALIVIAYFTALRALIDGVVSPSLTDMVQNIRSGAFDYVLLKPIDAQALVSASRYEPWKLFDLISAVALAVYAFSRLGPPAPGNLALGLAMLVSGVFAMYAIWLACSALSFWVVRMDNLVFLLDAIFDMGRWPVQVFQGLWRLVFTVVIPIAIISTYPAMALLGKLDATHVAETFGGCAALFIASRLVWRAAIRSYTSASS
jgi:ABC-2 type transport system permease protein